MIVISREPSSSYVIIGLQAELVTHFLEQLERMTDRAIWKFKFGVGETFA